MKEHEKLLLADAIETAIEAQKTANFYRRMCVVFACINIVLDLWILFGGAYG